MDILKIESLSLWISLIGYSLACVVAIFGVVLRKLPERSLFAIIAVSIALHTVAIGARWLRIGHLPVISGFEMLSANVWGLMVAVAIGYRLLPKVRAFTALVMPVVIMLMAWMLLKPAEESSLPPTYDTIWLFIHIGFGKVFLGAMLVSVGISGAILLRGSRYCGERLARMPDDARLDELSFRFMALALIFETLMLIAGAIWAQDAWGRYWAWDPLETWAFLTWLSLGFALHARFTYKITPRTNAILVISVFVLAFLTFFGVPFISSAAHQGAV